MFNLNIFEREELTPIRKLLMMRAIAGGAPLNEYEIEGNPVAFQTNVQKALTGFTIPFFPVQTGSGDPSPDNVRPISGWEGVTVWRTGGNLLDPSFAISTQNPNGYVNADGSLTITGRDGTNAKARGHITLPPGTYDFYSVFGSGYASRYTINDSTSETVFAGKHTVTITEQTDFYFKAAMGTDYPVTGWLQIFKSGAEYTEQKYQGASYPVTFPDGQTVYGGTLYPLDGVMTVEWTGFYAKDVTWVETSQVARGVFRIDDNIPARDLSASYNIICNTYKTTSAGSVIASMADLAIKGNETSGVYIYIRNSNYTSLEDFVASLDGVFIAYQIATPYEIQLDPITVQTLIGDNTIWTDTNGENTIRYKKKG